MESKEIIGHLPYGPSFLFVDRLLNISEEGIEGEYTFRPDAYFYESHFKDKPITPGVILIETMAQIALVCLGIYLMRDHLHKEQKIAFADSNVNFTKMVLPGEKVRVKGEKIYFRLRKLKVKAQMFNEAGEIVAKGTLAGMIIQ